jgi:predicted nucleotidyltransferase
MLTEYDIKTLKDYFAEHRDVAFAFLFGSQASGKARSSSDIDIAKIILMNEGITLPDTYRAIIKNLSIISDFKELNTERLSRLVILRYVISHEYLDIRWSSIKKFILETESLYRDLLDKVRSYIERKIKEEGEE